MILIVICEKLPTRWIRMLADVKRAYSDMFPLLRWLRAATAPWKVRKSISPGKYREYPRYLPGYAIHAWVSWVLYLKIPDLAGTVGIEIPKYRGIVGIIPENT